MKILLCGIPLGRNNVGDEAIIAGVVKILRGIAPDATLTVSTDDPATARRLGVEVCPLYGFDVVPFDAEQMARTVREHDVTVWAGATGLSDYPEIPCRILRIAQEAGKKSVVWNVGMNSELNPAKYTVGGHRRLLLSLVRKLALGAFDPLQEAEAALAAKARGAIREALTQCDLVVTRDPQSRLEVLRCGVDREVVAGADSALVLEPCPLESVPVAKEVLDAVRSPKPKVGICISAQRSITNSDGLLGYLDGLAQSGFQIVFLPMNPVTDKALMEELHERMAHRGAAVVAAGRLDPEHILALAGGMDVIVASRLHLLILASILHVPILGISRGSKVDNFLEPYGIKAAGSVEDCNFAKLAEDTAYWASHRDEFRERSTAVRGQLMARLETAKRLLGKVIA